MSTKVIYHGNCNDGFCAAWVAWQKFGDTAEYISANYGDEPPEVDSEDILYIVDFSYPRDVLLKLHGTVFEITVLDHHKTAQADLKGLGFCTFDMEQSGAMLTWLHFNGLLPRAPWIVYYVQDRDLWHFKLSGSKEINAAISSWPRDFEHWNRALEEGELMASGDGEAICRYTDQYTEEMCEQARLVEFGGHKVYCVNAPYKGISEICGVLAELGAFSMGWMQRGDGKYQYNLRSRGDFDVSALAREYGGGGHKASAGFVQDEPLELYPPRDI